MGSTEEQCLEDMSAPLLIRTLTGPYRPGVGGLQAPILPLNHTEEWRDTFFCGYQLTRQLEKLQEIWEILLKGYRERQSVSYMQMVEKLEDSVGWWIVFTCTLLKYIYIYLSATCNQQLNVNHLSPRKTHREIVIFIINLKIKMQTHCVKKKVVPRGAGEHSAIIKNS